MTVHHFSCDLEVLPTARLSKPTELQRLIVRNLPNPREICIYVISCELAVVYVGSSKSVGRTLATGHIRDYPYKWLKQRCGRLLNAHIFSFDLPFEGLKVETVREAIEGEVVFEIRRLTGQWPLAQNEIHFWEGLRTHRDVSECVDQVMSHLKRAGLVSGQACSPTVPQS